MSFLSATQMLRALVAFSCFAGLAGGQEINVKMFGGVDATPGQFPWQASLQHKPPQIRPLNLCDGVLIDATHVITTATCVRFPNSDYKYYQIVVGAHNLSDRQEPWQQRCDIQKITAHEGYEVIRPQDIFYEANNIAIITLMHPVEFNDRVKPLKLPDTDVDQLDKKECQSAGWDSSINNILKTVDLVIYERNICRELYKHPGYNITQSVICAGDPLKMQCPCKTGSPLVCENKNKDKYLCGLESFGVPPAYDKTFPMLYTNVNYFREWIQLNANQSMELKQNI